MKRIMSYVAMAAVAIALAPSAWAQCNAPLYGYTIDAFNSSTPNDPPVYFSIGGSGITGIDFSACEDSDEIQLGLRVIDRGVGPINPGGTENYIAPLGVDTDGNPKWNIEVSIDMGYDYGDPAVLPNEVGDLDSLILQYDCDPTLDVVLGPAYDLVKIAAFFPLPLVETTQLIQLSDNLGFPGRCAGFEIDPDAPGSYEFSLTASYGGEVVSETNAVAVLGQPPTVPVVTEDAAFTVIKTFEDLNDSEVEVELSCNTGLPLIQSQTLSPIYVDEFNNQVTFILSSLGESTANCTVSETPVPGYTPEYSDMTSTGTVDEDGCHYEDVAAGSSVLCGVINRVTPVPVTVYKVWEITGESDDGGYLATIAVECQNTAIGSETEFHFLTSSDNGDQTFSAYVKPKWDGSTYCDVNEDIVSSAVEVTGCEDPVSVDVGQTDAGCTLVNTVFFEGIPTLNQYGMALLALLMLGIGFVGFRRLV